MKHVTRNTYLIGLGLFIIGIVVMLIGFMLGAPREMYVDLDGWNFSSNEDYQLNQNLKSFDSLDINLTMTDFEIVPSDKFAIEVEGPVNRKPTITIKNNTLYLKNNGAKHQIRLFSFGTPKKEGKITLYVKKEVLYNKLKLENNFGKAVINGIKVERLTLENNFGEVDFDGTAQRIKTSNNFGEMNIVLNTITELSSSNNFGDTNIELGNQATDYRYDIDSSMGDVYIDHVKNNHADYGSQQLPEIELENDFGTIRINFNNKKSEQN